jgi:predicted nucleic acid-binding protein
MTAVDSSVVVAACASWHEAHESACRVLDRRPRLVAHCALEAFSVLTRLPSPHRIPPELVVAFLQDRFADEPLALDSARLHRLVPDLHELGVAGGAVYDGLVALSAATHGATLLTLDGRAVPTYRRCGVRHRLLTADA